MCDNKKQIAAGAVAALLVSAASAQTPELQIHGFAAQGLVISEGNNVYGDSTDKGGSSEFRELGINFSYRPRGSLLFAAQMAGVEAGQAIDEDLVLEYGLADYTALSGERGRFGVRGGKLKLPIGLYNDSRDAVFTRPGILLPESVYLENSGARAFGYFSAEGVGIYGDWYLGDHALYGELQFAGSQDLDDTAEIAILRTSASGRFKVDRGFVMRLADDYDGGRWRVALSLLTSDLRYEADAAPPPGEPFNRSGDFAFDQAVLSLQYNAERWSVTSELVGRHLELDDLSAAPFPLSPLIGPVKQDPAGWYLQGSYRITPRWQWLLRYDYQIRDLDDHDGRQQAGDSAALSAASGGAIAANPRHYFFARDWTTGTRFDVNASVSVLAEFHYVDGAGWVNPLDNPRYTAGGADRYWNLFTVMTALRF